MPSDTPKATSLSESYETHSVADVDYIILGGGGAGRTVAGALRRYRDRLAFMDDQVVEEEVNGIHVLGRLTERIHYSRAQYIVAFGSRYQRVRRAVFQQLKAEGYRFFNAVADEAYVDRHANLGVGIFIGAQCAVLPNAEIGDNCFVCVASTVDHDCVLGQGVYLSPGVHLSGAVVVEEGAFVGINAAVVPGVRIGACAVVGAGAVVLRDVAPGDVVAGVPARSLRAKEVQ